MHGVSAASASGASQRRRRTLPATAPPGLAAPVVVPVPGTPAAETAAAQQRHRDRTVRTHVLLEPTLTEHPERPRDRIPPGMTPTEAADRIVATLLRGSGPILLCVPGTYGGAYQSSMLVTARSVVRHAGGPVSVSSIPYPNGVRDIVTRFLGVGGRGEEQNVLALVLRRLRAAAPHRPILLAGESQGAWLIADTLRADPSLAAAVTRIVVFAKPGFVDMPEAIGGARTGASMLPGTASGVAGVLEFRHTDDIVPSLFSRLHAGVLTPYLDSLAAGQGFAYRPHHYDWHGDEAAAWLLHGTPPEGPEVHRSTVHPQRPARL